MLHIDTIISAHLNASLTRSRTLTTRNMGFLAMNTRYIYFVRYFSLLLHQVSIPFWLMCHSH
jgi:hypothetical protein